MTDRNAMCNLLLEGCESLGLELHSRQASQFMDYFDLVRTWNEKINLTAILEKREFIVKHFIDSLTGAFFVGSRGKLVDVGSGSGLPGLALKIYYPELEVCLVESVGKKAAFIERAAETLGLKGFQVITMRAEEMGQAPLYRETFDYAVCRAVGNLAVIAEYCLPLVKKGGCFVAYKGDKGEEELSRGAMAIKILGGGEEVVDKVSLPFLGDGRTLISIGKIAPSPEKYPRRTGIPAKRPLV